VRAYSQQVTVPERTVSSITVPVGTARLSSYWADVPPAARDSLKVECHGLLGQHDLDPSRPPWCSVTRATEGAAVTVVLHYLVTDVPAEQPLPAVTAGD
jgi:hypothetical protein